MIKLDDAVKIANEYFLKEYDLTVATAMDAETHWIFYAVPEDGSVIGNAGVKVEKATGNLEDFILPDDENFELLDRAKPIEMPQRIAPGKFFVM